MQRAPRPRQMLAPVALQHLAPRLPTLVDRLLCWLALYPFQPARSLLLALRTTPATLYRHIARASQQQLIEAVCFSRDSSRGERWYYLTQRGLEHLATRLSQQPRQVVSRWPCSETALLRLLPRLSSLATLQELIDGLIRGAPRSLADPQGTQRGPLFWTWQRDYVHAFEAHGRRHICRLDAVLLLHRAYPPFAAAHVSGQDAGALSLLILLDPDSLCSQRARRQELEALLRYREAAERWPVYQEFPLVLLLVPDQRQEERWRSAALEAASRLQLPPLQIAVTTMAPISPAPSSAWHWRWRDLYTSASCRLQERLRWTSLEAVPPDLLARSALPTLVGTSKKADGMPAAQPRGTRLIRGRFEQRAWMTKAALLSSSRQPLNEGDRRTLALLSLCLRYRHWQALEGLVQMPFAQVGELAVLMRHMPGAQSRVLADLHRLNCIQRLMGRRRWVLSARGAALLRMRSPCRHGLWLLTDRRMIPRFEHAPTRSQTRRQLAHLDGLYGLLVALCQQLGAQGGRLWAWELGPACERHFQDRRGWHRLRPDAFVIVDEGARQFRFWIEWDRATMGSVQWTRKLCAYRAYLRSRAWAAEAEALPALLIVVPETGQAERVARLVQQELANEGLLVRITTASRLAEHGPLAPIWWQVGPKRAARQEHHRVALLERTDRHLFAAHKQRIMTETNEA